MTLICTNGHDRCYLGPDPKCPYCERKPRRGTPIRPTKQQIELAADAIKFMVPLTDGTWTEHGMRVTKWPKDFTPDERRRIRGIVEAVLKAAL